jgi:hypothetical protein
MYPYPYISPVVGPVAPSAHRIHTDGVPHVIDTRVIGWPGGAYVRGLYYQITETVDTPTISAVIGLFLGSRAGAFTSDIAASLTTVPDNALAADTIYFTDIPPVLIDQGLTIGSMCHTAGTGGGPAGIVRIWWLLQPVGA